MRLADFELLVCRTTGLLPEAFVPGRIGAVVRSRAAARKCRTLDAYAEIVEVSPAELAALLAAAAEGATADPALAAAPSPTLSRAPDLLPTATITYLPTARLDPRFRRRRARRSTAPRPASARRPDGTAGFSRDDFGAAKRALAAHLRQFEPTAASLLLLGLIRDMEGHGDDADACYRAALARDPAGDAGAGELIAWLLARRTATTDASRAAAEQETLVAL